MHSRSPKYFILSIILFGQNIVAQAIPPVPPPPIPGSPFGDPALICPQTDGIGYSVGGFPGTPYKVIPFVDAFKNPPVAVPKHKACRADGHCMLSYD